MTHLAPPHPWLRSAITNFHQSFFAPHASIQPANYPKWLICTLKIEAACSSKLQYPPNRLQCVITWKTTNKSATLCAVFYIYECFKINILPFHLNNNHWTEPGSITATIKCVHNRTLRVTEEETHLLLQCTGTVTTLMTFIWEVLGSNISRITDNSEIFYGTFLNLPSKSSSELQTDLQCLLVNL